MTFEVSHLLGRGTFSDVLLVLALFAEQEAVDVGQGTTGRDGGCSKQLVDLLIVLHGEHNVAGRDLLFLLLGACVACELEDFATDVLKDGSHEDSTADTACLSVAALPDQAIAATDGENQVTTG